MMMMVEPHKEYLKKIEEPNKLQQKSNNKNITIHYISIGMVSDGNTILAYGVYSKVFTIRY